MKNKYNIGDHVYINTIEGDPGVVVAIVMYEDHLEYLVRFYDRGLSQLTEPELTEDKVIV